ncbi:type II toxin-antitoxin system HicA family toxin [Candidatus Calescamantes bacterium]|nr:type II toxin-antitoxin system HicA family toxin [Candidatus Calescamantes bacterium]
MAKIERLVRKMLNKPAEMLFTEVEYVLNYFGFIKNTPKGGSHFIFRKGEEYITVPRKKKKVKRGYILRIIEMLNLEEWYENLKKEGRIN